MSYGFAIRNTNRTRAISKLTDALRPFVYDLVDKDKDVYIACRGVSGLLVAPGVAASLGVPLVIVRKPSDGSHSCILIEGPWPPNEDYLPDTHVIIVDDFVETGNTVAAVVRALDHPFGCAPWTGGTTVGKPLFALSVWVYSCWRDFPNVEFMYPFTADEQRCIADGAVIASRVWTIPIHRVKT
jgi:hypothetical protein